MSRQLRIVITATFEAENRIELSVSTLRIDVDRERELTRDSIGSKPVYEEDRQSNTV